MKLDEKQLWEWIIHEDAYIFQEFGLAIVGIGALLVAYSQIDGNILRDLVMVNYLREFIAWIGLVGSVILALHIYGSSVEIEQTREKLRTTEKNFMEKLDWVQEWRGKGRYRFTYYPVIRLSMYFMLLMAWGWFFLIIIHHGVSPDSLLYVTLIVVLPGTLAEAIRYRVAKIRVYRARAERRNRNEKER